MRIFTAAILFFLSVPVVLAAGELSLDRCVELALQRNEIMTSAEKKLAETDARVREKIAAFWPSLGLTAGYTRLPYASASKAALLGGSLDDYNLSVTLTQPLYAGGKLWSEKESAELVRRKAFDQLAMTRTDLAIDVTSAYYSARHAEAVLSAKQQSYRHLADYFNKSSALARRTLLPRPEELLQIEVQMVNASIEVAAVENNYQAAVRRLLGLMKEKGTAAVFSGQLPAPAETAPPDPLTLGSNYQYRSALFDLSVARQAITISRSDLFPALNLNAYSGWEWAQLPPARDYSQWGISLELLLFDFLKTPAKVKQNELLVEQGMADLEIFARKIRLDYLDRIDALNSARLRFRLAEENLARAERSLSLYQARAQSYTVNSKQLLDAEQAALQARLNRLNVLLDYHLNRLELARLLGREKI